MSADERELVIGRLAELTFDPQRAMDRRFAGLGDCTPEELVEAGRTDDVLAWIADEREAQIA